MEEGKKGEGEMFLFFLYTESHEREAGSLPAARRLRVCVVMSHDFNSEQESREANILPSLIAKSCDLQE